MASVTAVVVDASAFGIGAKSLCCSKSTAATNLERSSPCRVNVSRGGYGISGSSRSRAAASPLLKCSVSASRSSSSNREDASSSSSQFLSLSLSQAKLSPTARARVGAGARRHWRGSTTSRATGADSNHFSSVEILDPQTGEYRNVGLSELEEEYGLETPEQVAAENADDPEALKRFAKAIGLDDEDVDAAGSMYQKMRNPTGARIVRQLEEGIGGQEDMLKDMYSDDDPEFWKLYTKIEDLIQKGDAQSARDIIDGNYDALVEQLQEGFYGIDQIAMLDMLASLYLLLEDTDSAEQLVGQAAELLQRLPEFEKGIENVLEHVATLYLRLKKPREAVVLFRRSLAIRETSGGDVASIVRTMVGLASTYSELQQGDKSVELYKRIVAYSEKQLGTEDVDLAAPLMHLGSSLLDDGKVEEAELIIERAIKLTEKAFGGKDGRYGVAVCVLAQIKGSKGEFEEAVECFRKGLRVMEVSKDFSSADVSLTTVRMDLAALLSVLGRESEAQEELRKSSAVQDLQQQEYYCFQKVDFLEKLAEQHAAAGELEQAERALRQGLQLLVATVGPDGVQVSVILMTLATLLHAQPDRQPEAEPLVRDAIRMREKIFGVSHLAVGEAYSLLASILHHQEQEEEAADLMYRVLHIQEEVMGSDYPQIEETLEVLNMLLLGLGRYQETIPLIQRLDQLKSQSTTSVDF